MATVHFPSMVCSHCCAGIGGQGGVPDACTIYKGDALCFKCFGRARNATVTAETSPDPTPA